MFLIFTMFQLFIILLSLNIIKDIYLNSWQCIITYENKAFKFFVDK